MRLGPVEGFGAELIAGTLEDGDGDGDDELGCAVWVGVLEFLEDCGEGGPVRGVEEGAVGRVRREGEEEEGGELVSFVGG